MRTDVKVMLSNRHVHLKQETLEQLFGPGYELTMLRMTGVREFAAKETVTLEGPSGKIENVRVLGPLRSITQVELLRADNFKLGISAPARHSGDLNGAVTLRLVGPCGAIDVPECAIIALRHIHVGATVAAEFGVAKDQVVSVKVGGERGLVFNNVVVRIGRSNSCTIHVDTEEGNAAGLKNGDIAELVL